jgi:glycerophosphoryl diester phosphodiesterase
MKKGSDPFFTVLAHRGARGHAPENTLKAFDKALELGARWIELDVQFHAGELWVFHDQRLERCTNGAGWLVDHDARVLRALDAGGGQQIPFLREVLNHLRGRVSLNIELKTGDGTAAAVAA